MIRILAFLPLPYCRWIRDLHELFERLELVHRSATRAHFAHGAARAAAWLVGRPAGLHPLERVLGLD